MYFSVKFSLNKNAVISLIQLCIKTDCVKPLITKQWKEGVSYFFVFQVFISVKIEATKQFILCYANKTFYKFRSTCQTAVYSRYCVNSGNVFDCENLTQYKYILQGACIVLYSDDKCSDSFYFHMLICFNLIEFFCNFFPTALVSLSSRKYSNIRKASRINTA